MSLVVDLIWADGADTSLELPGYETAGAAGMDLRANFPENTREAGVLLAPGARALIPTGLRMAIPLGFEAQIRPRSGLALKSGISLVNSPGTIDADYRGSIGVIVINHGHDDFIVTHGMRIAQMIFAPVVQGQLRLVGTLPETDRGTGGFGSTGKS